jgi:RNA polymerase sigma-70 factor (ECF subfamily)
MTDTARLVQQARNPEAPPGARREAFSTLVRRYQDAAFGYAYALLGDPHQAQDATQEALLDAYRRLDALRVPEAFPGWLRRIVRTHCLRLRRAKEPLPVPLDHSLSLPGGPDPVAAAEAGETRAIVAAAIDALPAHERPVTLLYYAGDYPQAEIARFLDLPVNTVKKRLQSSRRRLRERMLEMVRETLRGERPSRDERLVEVIGFRTAMEAVADTAEATLVEQLLVDGLEVDAPDASGRTLLSWAAQRGHLDTVEVLLRHGADPGAPDRSGRTPLQWARTAGQRQVTALLRRPSPPPD